MANVVIILIHAKLLEQGLACSSMLNKLIGTGQGVLMSISYSYTNLRLDHIIKEAKLSKKQYCRVLKDEGKARQLTTLVT